MSWLSNLIFGETPIISVPIQPVIPVIVQESISGIQAGSTSIGVGCANDSLIVNMNENVSNLSDPIPHEICRASTGPACVFPICPHECSDEYISTSLSMPVLERTSACSLLSPEIVSAPIIVNSSSISVSNPVIPTPFISPPPLVNYDETPLPADTCSRIIVLLDESGSMEMNRLETVEAINAFIDTQKDVTSIGDRCRFSLISFSDLSRTIINDVPLQMVDPLMLRQYKPNGCTALYDAIGEVIESFQGKKRVILVILTDGQENSSRKHTRSSVASQITHCTEKMDWNVVYLAADPLLSEQGNALNITQDESKGTSNCSTDFAHLALFARLNLGRAVSSYRSGITRSVTIG